MSDFDDDDGNLDLSEHAEDICVPGQGEIAIFTALDGRSVALWQRRWLEHDDCILISHRYLPDVIARLQRLADGIAACRRRSGQRRNEKDLRPDAERHRAVGKADSVMDATNVTEAVALSRCGL